MDFNNNILVLDDDLELLAAYRNILQPKKRERSRKLAAFAELDEDDQDNKEKLVFNVTAASQGEQGVELVRDSIEKNRHFAVAIIDIRMPPGIDGLETARKIRDLDSSVYIIIITAYSDRSIEEIQRNVRHDVVLARKPISNDELIQQVRNACNNWDRDRELKSKSNELESVNKELKEKIKIFDKFVPKNFIKVLDSAAEDGHIQLGNCAENEMTVMFSDIRSFTAFSETITPKDSFQFINSYLGHMGPIVRKNDGFIDKFMGDGIMALFDNADNGIQTAIEMMQRLCQYNEGRKRAGYVPIAIGVGINQGPLTLGTIGEEDRMQTTVIGDTVNLAARTEMLTKIYGAPILLTEHAFRGIKSASRYSHRFLDTVKIKGKTEQVEIYEILDVFPDKIKERKMEVSKLYEKAVMLYYNKETQAATSIFQQCLGICPDDVPTRIFLQRCWGMAPNYETSITA
jgi:adenylate cyclase